MRTALLAFACLLVGSMLRGDEPLPDLKRLEGTWEVVEFTVSGKVIPEGERPGMKFEVSESTMKMTARGRDVSFEIKLDPTKTPRTIDYTALDGPMKGKTNYGIYELNGNELKLCMHNRDANTAPSEFKSVEGDKLALFVLRRKSDQP